MLFEKGEWTSRDFPCRILQKLPGGHMAELYTAKLENTEHLVVVKTVEAAGTEQKLLMREAQVLSRLRHNGIPEIFGYFREKEKSYYIMSYHPGMDLERFVVQNGCMREVEVRRIAMEACRILAYLHSERISIVHNDLKPANFLLQDDGLMVLLDFGLAEYFRGEQEEIYFKGTLGYAAPECWHREQYEIGPAADIFALGATMFYLLEGKEPKDNYGKFVISDADPQKKNRWQSVLDKCCALDIRKRYQSAAEVYEVLNKLKV